MAERLFITPPGSRRSPDEAGWASCATASTLATDAGDLAVWTWGDAPPTALLVHGWAGRGLQLGALAAPLVARGFKVVTYDAPGHGSSPGRTSSLIEMAHGAGAMARALGDVEVVVSHSLGATAVVLAAGRGELQPRRVVAIAPAASLAGIVARFGEMVGLTAEVEERLRRRLAIRFHFDWTAAEPLAIAPRMQLPLLVVRDSEDRVVPPAEGARLAAVWPGATLRTTSGLGHFRVLRDRTVINHVTDFIQPAREAAPSGHHQRLTA